MENIFDIWNQKKQEIHKAPQTIFFREGEIWWINLGINVGIEQNGKGNDFIRPVLILKKYNKYHCLIVPLTTQKAPQAFSFFLSSEISFLKKDSWVIFSQIRVIDSRRFFEKMGKIHYKVFNQIKKEAREKIFPFTSD